MTFDGLMRVRGGARLRDALLRHRVIARGRPRAYWFTGVPNFGDELSSAVLEWVTGSRPVWVPKLYRGKILGVGSILQSALAPRDTVWGSGLIQDVALVPPPGVRFLAVRGPLTRNRIAGDVPEIYGDPALLLPRFHCHRVEKRYDLGVIPHYIDQNAVSIDDPTICVIDVKKSWGEVVDTIRACQTVISSSLHGLIVAEAYGIPAAWIRITDGVTGSGFKFNDYFTATGRSERAPVAWARGLDHALRNTLPALRYDALPLLRSAVHLVHST